MRPSRSIAALVLSATVVTGSSVLAAVPAGAAPAHAAVAAQAPAQDLLTDIPVTGTVPGGTFSGLLDITNVAVQNGQLVVSGVLTGATTIGGVVTQVTQTFTNLPLALLNGGGASCDILNLDLGPLNLDLLGLVVDLSPISLDITAERGPGKLLGNLLCAVAGLLDGNGPLAGLTNLLNLINRLLG